ncbi:MAG: hypothetical protein FWF70_05810 [Bacteroidetes bacterium]|nr:hypothetical protein [Bacteroidota bacterium]MCL1968926.1 hypothetical protein [Bacteroidota bacterium]
MKVAYLILAHHQPILLKELITALNKPKEQVFVHINKKVDIQPFETLLKDKCIFTEQREKIYWASFSFKKAYMHLIKAAMAIEEFDYYTFLSGVDFPIKPIKAFEAFLEQHRGSEFIEALALEDYPDDKILKKKQRRYSGYFIFPNYPKFFLKLNFGIAKIQRIFYKRKPYKGEKIFHGLTFCTLTHACLQYIIDRIESEPALSRYFKFTFAPDEMFFHTIIGNSPFAEKIIHNNLHCIVFEEGKSNPKVWRMEDKEILLSSQDYFARKFDLSIDAAIIDLLKQHISLNCNPKMI